MFFQNLLAMLWHCERIQKRFYPAVDVATLIDTPWRLLAKKSNTQAAVERIRFSH